MKESSTTEKSKTKSSLNEEPSQRTLDYLMLLARSFDVEKESKKPLHFDVCLN